VFGALPPPGSPLPGIAPPDEPRLAPGLPRPPSSVTPDLATQGATHPIDRVVIDGV